MLVDRIDDPAQRLDRTLFRVLHHGHAVVVDQTTAMRVDQRRDELDQPAFLRHREHHRIVGNALLFHDERLLDQLIPGFRRGVEAGFLELRLVIEEGHVVGVISQAVLTTAIGHGVGAEILGLGVVFHQAVELVDRGDPAGFGPFGQPGIRHPHRVERRTAHEFRDHALAVLGPGRVTVIDRNPGFLGEGAEVALHGVDRGRPGVHRQRGRFGLGRTNQTRRHQRPCARRRVAEEIPAPETARLILEHLSIPFAWPPQPEPVQSPTCSKPSLLILFMGTDAIGDLFIRQLTTNEKVRISLPQRKSHKISAPAEASAGEIRENVVDCSAQRPLHTSTMSSNPARNTRTCIVTTWSSESDRLL